MNVKWMVGAFCLSLAADVTMAETVVIGPRHYTSVKDSPWAAFLDTDQQEDFFLEDFEDGELNTPGVLASTGSVLGPSIRTNSVDADDGKIDGSGRNGHSWMMIGAEQGLTFLFLPDETGGYPTVAGIVWTDGADSIEDRPGAGPDSRVTHFRVLGPNDEFTGQTEAKLAVRSPSGTTVDDNFFGVIDPDGIKAITLWNFSQLQVDHLQYGSFAREALASMVAHEVPEPSSLAAFIVAGGLSSLLIRRRCPPPICR